MVSPRSLSCWGTWFTKHFTQQTRTSKEYVHHDGPIFLRGTSSVTDQWHNSTVGLWHHLLRTYHSDSRTHSFGREVLAKLCSYDSTVAVGTSHLAPDYPILARLFVSPLLWLLVHPVDIRYSLATVVTGLLPTPNTIQLQKGGTRMLVTSPTCVPNKYTLIIQPKVTKLNTNTPQAYYCKYTDLTGISFY